MLNKNEIFETVNMFDAQNLDVRTITMAISLFDCVSADGPTTARNVYDKVYRLAGSLVPVGEEISAEYGVPIVNKRVSVTPVSLIGAASGDYLSIARALDRAAAELGIDFIGGYGALVHKSATPSESAFLATIPEALSTTQKVCSSVSVGSTKSGINLDVIGLMGKKIKELAYLTRDADGIGCAKLVLFCNAVEDNPFMAGAFNGVGEGEAVINVGVSGPGVVQHAISLLKDAPIDVIADTVKKTAFKITRLGGLVLKEAARRTGAEEGIVDLSLAPTPKVGDSVAHILEEMGLSSVGACGTTACLALLNDAVKKGGLMASGSVGGLSGAFIPVSEDVGMINAARRGTLTLEKLEAMTAVCSVGLDMIAIPGDTPDSTIAALIADECAIGMINNKTTAVRVIPVYGKKVGDEVSFGGLLGTAPIMPISGGSAEKFISRGGRIPAPLNSLRN